MARGIIGLVLISGIGATVRQPRVIFITTGLIVFAMVVGFEDAVRPNLSLDLTNDAVSVFFLAVLTVLILLQVNRVGPITWRRVEGAIAAYLLIGLLWAVAYQIVELLRPGSFRVGIGDYRVQLPQLGYFSFTTLATLGLGDVLPVTPPARSLVVLEALIGQLFPVILIARLVAMELEYRRGAHP